MALVGEAQLGGYFREAQIRFDQQPFGTLNAQLKDVLVRGHPRGSLELTVEVKAAQGSGGCELLQVDRSIDVSSDQVEDLKQFVRRQALLGGQYAPLRSCAG